MVSCGSMLEVRRAITQRNSCVYVCMCVCLVI
jgi:hypothetical protein